MALNLPSQRALERYACGDLLVALWAPLLPVGPAVLWWLRVRASVALGLAVPGPLLDDVEQVKGVLMLPVRALGLAPLVAVLAGGVVPPAQLDAGAQTLHDGVVQLWDRGAPGGAAANPTGHRP